MKTKMMLLLIISMLTLTLYSQETGRESMGKQPGNKEQTEMLIYSKVFVFHARRALPSRMASIDLTTNPGYVKFSPDLIESSMPFFGRAYSGIGYGGDSGLRFKGQPDIFEVEKKRKKYHVTANVKGGNDNYELFLTVMPEGNATLSISSNNRETISYYGEIREVSRER